MIKTPVARHNVFTSSFVDKFGCFLDDKSLNEAAKRINLHDELVCKLNEVLSLHGSDYVSEQSNTGEDGDITGHVIGFELLDSIEQLLEKCK